MESCKHCKEDIILNDNGECNWFSCLSCDKFAHSRCAEKNDWQVGDGMRFDNDVCDDCFDPNICVYCNIKMKKNDITVECEECCIKVHKSCASKNKWTTDGICEYCSDNFDYDNSD
jgi:hypothetical protein